jgi:long-subunit acyl-CoA synthetase (AMP-forming)
MQDAVIQKKMTGFGDVAEPLLILDHVYQHESKTPNRLYLTQPIGGREVVDYTWAEVVDQSRRMAAHILAQGFGPGARVAILSKNCAHFILAELAIWMAGATTVAIFPTETPETIRYVLEDSGASLLFVGKLDAWDPELLTVIGCLPCVAFPLAPDTPFEPWDAIVARTPALSGKVKRQADDLAFICYTSGSTGQPKGVMHSFGRISRTAQLMEEYTAFWLGQDFEARILSYLPLAHIYERAWVECLSLVSGQAHIYFAENLDSFMQDMNRARPNTYISVPRLWLKFQQAVLSKIPPKTLDRLLDDPVHGPLVAQDALKSLGLDQVVMASSGSAPIPAELITWYQRLGLNLLEGYGMTEDFAYSHASSPEVNAPGYVGIPLPSVEVRISDEGEILIKSPGQMVGYYKRPDLNAEIFTPDGFFRTGDTGERLPNGLLKITGRIKELFKTSKGKYVAPAPIENQFNNHPVIESTMVSGVGQAAPYAMVVLAEYWRPKQKDPSLRSELESQILKLLHDINSRLASHEQLKMVVVMAEPWTIQNGCLTPTLKIKRSRIESAVSHQVEAWYQSKQPVIWT